MAIKIGEKSYATISRPSDLDEQLVSTTGCNAAELAAQMGGSPLASTVAVAIRPFLKDPLSVPDLASVIAAAGVMDVQRQVAALYTSALTVKAVADAT